MTETPTVRTNVRSYVLSSFRYSVNDYLYLNILGIELISELKTKSMPGMMRVVPVPFAL